MIDRELLYQKYIIEKLSQRDVAKFFGVTSQTIWNNCKKHGFIRSPEENYAIGVKKAHETWAKDRESIVNKMTHTIRKVTAERGEEMKANRRRTMQERYGVNSVGDLPHKIRAGSNRKGRKVTVSPATLHELYISQNKTQSYCAAYFGVSSITICRLCKKLGFEKDMTSKLQGAKNYWENNKEKVSARLSKQNKRIAKERGAEVQAKREATVLSRFGVKSMVELEAVRVRARQSSLEKYGTVSPFQRASVREHIQALHLKKYGARTPLQSPEIKEKIKNVFLKKYGAYNISDVEPIRCKIRKTNESRFGVPYPFQNSEIRLKAKQTNTKRYGANGAGILHTPEVRRKAQLKCRENGFVSKGEQDLFDFIKELCPDAQQGDYSVLKNRELDIYIPSKHIAIEYNGEYWHSDVRISYDKRTSHSEAKRYHYNKHLDCKQQGIQLIHIWESEWLNKREIWESKLRSILNENIGPTVYARQCIVKEINPSVKSSFLNEHHIQGNDHSSSNFGLYHDDELVAVMTFRKSRNNKEVELSRYATSRHIPGGFSKLLKHSGYKNVTSWSDNRLSNGNMYERSGWVKIKETGPDYQVFHNKRIYHKSAFKRQNIKNKFPEYYSEQLTEWEMEDNIPNCFRIWDCGKTKWAYNS